MRGETLSVTKREEAWKNFNPLPACEGRLEALYAAQYDADFNPLPSHEGRQGGRIE